MNCHLLIVMLGAFVAQTTEYLPIGLLPQIGRGFGVSGSSVGILVTGYAWLAALTAVPLTLATNRLNRRTLFSGLLALVAIANLFAALSPGYTILAAMRIVTALTHGVFWSTLASFATRLAPEMPTSRALAWAFGGISLAVVAGVPLATAVGEWAGWREAFGLFGILAAIISLAAMRILPAIANRDCEAQRGLPRGNARLFGAALVTTLIVASHFCSYTYIVSLLTSVARVPEVQVPLLLLVFGVAGAVGTLISGWLGFQPVAMAFIAASGIVVNQALLKLAGNAPAVAWLSMVLWGTSISMLIVGLQGWILKLAPQHADSASALYVAAFNACIGGGAMAGGLSLNVAGDRSVLTVGIILGVMACASFPLPSILSRRIAIRRPGMTSECCDPE